MKQNKKVVKKDLLTKVNLLKEDPEMCNWVVQEKARTTKSLGLFVSTVIDLYGDGTGETAIKLRRFVFELKIGRK